MHDDADLIARAREGDREAFGILAERYFSTVWAVALSVTGEEADAEDVAQDALVRAWQRLDGLKDAGRLRAWLARLTRRVALNRVDARGRRSGRREHLTGDDTGPGVPAHEASPLEHTWRGELRRTLLSAARRLTDIQRQVLLLYDLEGFSHREVAEALDISEVTSRRHLSDARKRMREMLDPAVRESGGLP